MKAPSDGGLPALHRSSTRSTLHQNPQVARRRGQMRRQGSTTPGKSSLLNITLEVCAILVLLASFVMCFTVRHIALNRNLIFGEHVQKHNPWLLPGGTILCSVAMAILLGWFFTKLFRSKSAGEKTRQRQLGLILLLPAMTGLMTACALTATNLDRDSVGTTIAGASITASCLLFATVIGRTASTLVAVAMCSILVSLGIFDPAAIWAVGISSIAGQYSAKALRNRSAVIRAAAVTMSFAGITGFVVEGLASHDIADACTMGMQTLLTGCLGAAIWFTLITVMERPYELSTPLGLLELLDPTRPILERFAREAPGTFAHSIMVGHLAATAADSIGADALLCRVAAQYHDIGKLARAQFFKENQPTGENVHDRLNPSLSAIVVNSHVKDGEKMARELGLPSEICDIITQHHGTTLMRYFYYRASSTAQPRLDDPLQYQFRYSGPKPQSKEAAIMMLADSIEAASRTLVGPTPESVDALIAGIISDRVQDHQLDECPLTIKDMTTIRETFTHVLCAMMHQRVEYPSLNKAHDEDILTEPVATRMIGSRNKILSSAPFDFYEDFDPSVLSQAHFGRFDQPPTPNIEIDKTPYSRVRRAKGISATRRENSGRRFSSGAKRPHNR